MSFGMEYSSKFLQKGDTRLDALRKFHFWALEQVKNGNLIAVEYNMVIIYIESKDATQMERRKGLSPQEVEQIHTDIRMMLASSSN